MLISPPRNGSPTRVESRFGLLAPILAAGPPQVSVDSVSLESHPEAIRSGAGPVLDAIVDRRRPQSGQVRRLLSRGRSRPPFRALQVSLGCRVGTRIAGIAGVFDPWPAFASRRLRPGVLNTAPIRLRHRQIDLVPTSSAPHHHLHASTQPHPAPARRQSAPVAASRSRHAPADQR